MSSPESSDTTTMTDPIVPIEFRVEPIGLDRCGYTSDGTENILTVPSMARYSGKPSEIPISVIHHVAAEAWKSLSAFTVSERMMSREDIVAKRRKIALAFIERSFSRLDSRTISTLLEGAEKQTLAALSFPCEMLGVHNITCAVHGGVIFDDFMASNDTLVSRGSDGKVLGNSLISRSDALQGFYEWFFVEPNQEGTETQIRFDTAIYPTSVSRLFYPNATRREELRKHMQQCADECPPSSDKTVSDETRLRQDLQLLARTHGQSRKDHMPNTSDLLLTYADDWLKTANLQLVDLEEDDDSKEIVISLAKHLPASDEGASMSEEARHMDIEIANDLLDQRHVEDSCLCVQSTS